MDIFTTLHLYQRMTIETLSLPNTQPAPVMSRPELFFIMRNEK